MAEDKQPEQMPFSFNEVMKKANIAEGVLSSGSQNGSGNASPDAAKRPVRSSQPVPRAQGQQQPQWAQSQQPQRTQSQPQRAQQAGSQRQQAPARRRAQGSTRPPQGRAQAAVPSGAPVNAGYRQRQSAPAASFAQTARSKETRTASLQPADQGFFEGSWNNQSLEEAMRKPKKKKKAFKAIIIVLALALLTWVGALGFSAIKAKDSATNVLSSVSTARKALSSNDYAAALEVVDSLTADAKELNNQLSGPQWALAEFVPVLGDDVKAARILCSTLDDLSAGVLVPLSDVVDRHPIGDIISSDGVDGTAVAELCDVVVQTAPLMQEASDKIDNLPTIHISALNAKVAPMISLFSEGNGLYQMVAQNASEIKGLLGIDGPRTYLIVAQNSAELRASGGFPGALGALSIDNGTVDMGGFDTPYNLMSDTYPEDVVFPDATAEMFPDNTYIYPRDVGYDPDFAYCAQVWASAYEAQTGRYVDGVISVVPAVVQRVLALVGKVTLSDGTEMTGENATKVLQSDLYWKYIATDVRTSASNQINDQLFAEAAQKSFKKLMSGLNMKKLKGFVELAIDCASRREIMVQLSNESEQAIVQEMGLSGDFVNDATQPTVGLFLSVTNGSKLGWYVDIASEVSAGTRNEDGTTSYQVNATFSNVMDPDEVAAAGRLIAGVYEGEMAPSIHIFASRGGSIGDFSCDMPEITEDIADQFTEPVEWQTGEYEGLGVTFLKRGSLKPGESIACSFTVTVPAGANELKVATPPVLTEYR